MTYPAGQSPSCGTVTLDGEVLAYGSKKTKKMGCHPDTPCRVAAPSIRRNSFWVLSPKLSVACYLHKIVTTAFDCPRARCAFWLVRIWSGGGEVCKAHHEAVPVKAFLAGQILAPQQGWWYICRIVFFAHHQFLTELYKILELCCSYGLFSLSYSCSWTGCCDLFGNKPPPEHSQVITLALILALVYRTALLYAY